MEGEELQRELVDRRERSSVALRYRHIRSQLVCECTVLSREKETMNGCDSLPDLQVGNQGAYRQYRNSLISPQLHQANTSWALQGTERRPRLCVQEGRAMIFKASEEHKPSNIGPMFWALPKNIQNISLLFSPTPANYIITGNVTLLW